MEGGNVSLIGTMRAKVLRERSEHLEQLEKERCQKKKKLVWDTLCMHLFGYKHSHQSKIINYFEAEEKNSMDIIMMEINLEELYMKMRVKRHTLMSPNISKGKRKMAGKKCWVCKSPFHQKNTCPNILCFFCKKPGHIKDNCIYRKINYVFNRLKEILHEKDKKEKKKEKLKARKKARK